MLAIHRQGLSAGDQDREFGRGREHFGDIRSRSQNLLEVVQDQQQLAGAQMLGERLLERERGCAAHAQRLSNCLGHQLGVAHRR